MPGRRDDVAAFHEELRSLGVPARLSARLLVFLEARHPGDQDKIYHGLAHSLEVALLTARLLDRWPKVPAARKVLLILAASLHDVDPDRRPNTPARVSATIRHLRTDPHAKRLLKDFGALFGFTTAQVCALVLATDYSPHPSEMEGLHGKFERAHRAAFGEDPWIDQWGKRLAYWDQISTYLGPKREARRRVAGLAREFRAQGAKFRPEGGFAGLSRRFLLRLRAEPLFEYLPAADRARFDAVVAALTARPAKRRLPR